MALDSKPSVLIVEDDPVWAATLSERLRSSYTIHHYMNGEEAIENILNIKPKIVVLDYHLDGAMTGLDTLKSIRKIFPETRVIMFTAQDSVPVAVEMFDNGAYDYVAKGDAAYNRLRIIMRNIDSSEVQREQLISLNLQIKRERFWLIMVVIVILIVSFIIYLRICPAARLISWDPFGVSTEEACMEMNKTINMNPH